jgi:hypothetical protein
MPSATPHSSLNGIIKAFQTTVFQQRTLQSLALANVCRYLSVRSSKNVSEMFDPLIGRNVSLIRSAIGKLNSMRYSDSSYKPFQTGNLTSDDGY